MRYPYLDWEQVVFVAVIAILAVAGLYFVVVETPKHGVPPDLKEYKAIPPQERGGAERIE